MNGVQEIFGLRPGEKIVGEGVKLDCFAYDSTSMAAKIVALAAMDGGDIFKCTEGEYIRLIVDGEVMMTDTPMERKSNKEFVNKAHGRVLIAGLGIGLIIYNLLDKIRSGEVTEIVVFENNPEVIRIVEPKIRNILPRDFGFNIVCKDILLYTPEKGDVFDTIYFDIWADICVDNLEQIQYLHRKWRRNKRKGSTTAWMSSWFKEYLEKKNAKLKKEAQEWASIFGIRTEEIVNPFDL